MDSPSRDTVTPVGLVDHITFGCRDADELAVLDADAKLAKVRDLVITGGTEVRRVDENSRWWIVMLAPEGNEFCVV